MEQSYVLRVTGQKFKDLYLYFCGYSKCKSGHSFGPAVRPNYIIHYILEGKGTYQVGSQKYLLRKGQGFLIEPETLTYYQADTEHPWAYLWIGFAGDNAVEHLRDIGLNHEQLIFQSSHSEELIEIIRAMLRYTAPTTSDLYVIQSLLYSFFAVLTKDTVVCSSEKAGNNNEYVQKAIDYIRNNYFRGIGVQDVSDYLSIDRSYLYTLFVQNLKTTPKEFLTQFRITRAQELLSYTDISIEDVASSCGYHDTLVFSKAFKRITGQTPSTFRKSQNIAIQESLQSAQSSLHNILT